MTVENTTQEPTIYSENEYTLKNGEYNLVLVDSTTKIDLSK